LLPATHPNHGFASGRALKPVTVTVVGEKSVVGLRRVLTPTKVGGHYLTEVGQMPQQVSIGGSVF
jgi:hypothetical protein